MHVATNFRKISPLEKMFWFYPIYIMGQLTDSSPERIFYSPLRSAVMIGNNGADALDAYNPRKSDAGRMALAGVHLYRHES